MKTLTLALAAAFAMPALVVGQEAKKEEEEVIDIEKRKASIPIIEDHIKDREERMTEIANDIMSAWSSGPWRRTRGNTGLTALRRSGVGATGQETKGSRIPA